MTDYRYVCLAHCSGAPDLPIAMASDDHGLWLGVVNNSGDVVELCIGPHY